MVGDLLILLGGTNFSSLFKEGGVHSLAKLLLSLGFFSICLTIKLHIFSEKLHKKDGDNITYQDHYRIREPEEVSDVAYGSD